MMEALERAGSDVGGEADRPRGRGFFVDAKKALVRRRRSTTLPANHDGRGELLMKLAFAIKSLKSVEMAMRVFWATRDIPQGVMTNPMVCQGMVRMG